MSTRVISVTRQTGAAGEEVAEAVAERLGFRYFDHQIVQAAAARAEVSPETIAHANEQTPSLATRFLEALARGSGGTADPWNDPFPLADSPMMTSRNYRRLIERVVEDLAEQEDVVIVGHSSSVVLRERADTLRVFVTASVAKRVERIMELTQSDEKRARRLVRETDRDRTDFFRRFYDVDWLSAISYDLCINTDHISPSQAAEIVVARARLATRNAAPGQS